MIYLLLPLSAVNMAYQLQTVVSSHLNSSCRDDSDDCGLFEGSLQQEIYTTSCNNSLNEFLESNLIIVGGVGIAFGVFEVHTKITVAGITCGAFLEYLTNSTDTITSH